MAQFITHFRNNFFGEIVDAHELVLSFPLNGLFIVWELTQANYYAVQQWL